MIKNRKCGSCRECCIVLDVEPMDSPRNSPCPKLCAAGCGIYETRPVSCRTFTCAWLEGAMSRAMQPKNTHHVVWASKLLGLGDESLPVIQCDVGRGRKPHKKTLIWLLNASFKHPVLIVQDGRCEMYNKGESVAKWHEGDFLNFDYDGSQITGCRVIPHSEVLDTEEKREAFLRTAGI